MLMLLFFFLVVEVLLVLLLLERGRERIRQRGGESALAVNLRLVQVGPNQDVTTVLWLRKKS